MKGQTMRRMFTIALGGMMMLAAITAVHADTIATTVIDDFTSDTLNANWVQSAVALKPAGLTPYTFDTTTVADQLTIKNPTYVGVRMDALLRSDVGLGIGQTLVTDLTVPATVADSHGLLITTATGVTGVPSSAAVHVPNALFVGWFPGNLTVRTIYYNLSGAATSVTTLAFTGGAVPTEFFIERTAANIYEAGYIKSGTGGLRVVLNTWTIDNGAGNLNPGAAIGYRADYRVTSAGASASFDNLRIESVIPEPATLGLLALGGLLMLPRRR